MDERLDTKQNLFPAIRRRLPLGLAIAGALGILTLAISLGLPALYTSRAIILIEQQEIPQDLVRSLVTSFADQRIQTISQRVLTNSNLSTIIEKYGLYSKERVTSPMEVVLQSMRKDITVKPISADVVDPKQGKAVQATIAFELAFESKNPELAQRVANEIVSLFLNENLKQRTEISEETLGFLDNESTKLRSEISDLEKKLAEFKQDNLGELPELSAFNLEMLNRTESEIAQVDSQIRSLEQQRVYLESELSQQKPSSQLFSETGERILGPGDRLKVLESEFIPLAARYGPNHPDVISKKREIESLRTEVGVRGKNPELKLKLTAARIKLAEASKKYSSNHPDILKLRREVEALTAQAAQDVSAPVNRQRALEAVDNPAYLQLAARLEATTTDIQALRSQRIALKNKMNSLEAKITKSPQVERQYRMLSRDYEAAQLKYQEVLAKRQEAELASTLESKQQGERFTLIEPPVTPEKPSKPNRLAIGLLGGLLAVAGGVGSGALTEALDSRVHGRSGVAKLIGVPPLAVVPRIETAESRSSARRRRIMWSFAIAVLIFMSIVLIHFTVAPVDVLFFQALRLVGFG